MGSSVTVQLQQVFEEYSVKLKRVTNNSADVIAKQAIQRIRSSSPRKSGSYARGWGIKRERGVAGINTVIIRNRTDYQLTHLLEKGHLIRNRKGVYGNAPAHPHIKPVEEWANQELPREIERELQ